MACYIQAQGVDVMNRRKRKFYAVIVLMCAALCATLMFSGCPDPSQGGGEEPGENPTPPEVPVVHPTISFTEQYIQAMASIDQDSWTVPSGTVVTITLDPSSGSEPSSFGVFRTGSNVPVAPVTHHEFSYTYTFTMPAYSVVIRVAFISILDAIGNFNDRITPQSSWEDIAFFNELIRKAQRIPSVVASDTAVATALAPGGSNVILKAIQNLAGDDSVVVPPGNIMDFLGIVEYKIRNWDLYEEGWISPNEKPPSVKDEKWPAAIGNPAPPAPPPVPPVPPAPPNMTKLFYVEEDNQNPTVEPKTGWVRSAGSTPIQTAAPPPYVTYGVREFTLTYTVGTGSVAGYPFPTGWAVLPDPIIKYNIWLVPVAQYTLVYELNAEPFPGPGASTVSLDQYTMTAAARPPAAAGADPAATVGTFGSQQLFGRATETTAKVIGEVGLLFPGTTDRELYVKVSTTNPDIAVRVTTSDGTIVKGIDSTLLDSIKNPTAAGAGAYPVDRFYPESRHYIIKVRPVSAPMPIR